LLAPQTNGDPPDRSVVAHRERDGRLELFPTTRASGRTGIRVRPKLLGIGDERTSAAVSALPLRRALVVVKEHEEHTAAAVAALARNDLDRTTIDSITEELGESDRHAVANLIFKMHGHIVPDAADQHTPHTPRGKRKNDETNQTQQPRETGDPCTSRRSKVQRITGTYIL